MYRSILSQAASFAITFIILTIHCLGADNQQYTVTLSGVTIDTHANRIATASGSATINAGGVYTNGGNTCIGSNCIQSSSIAIENCLQIPIALNDINNSDISEFVDDYGPPIVPALSIDLAGTNGAFVAFYFKLPIGTFGIGSYPPLAIPISRHLVHIH